MDLRTHQLALAFDHEWNAARDARHRGELAIAVTHLERAHILGQTHTWRHLKSHVGMLHIGWLRRDHREILGQVPRMVAATLFSRIWVPRGNTGGANVSAFRPMPVPADLLAVLGSSPGEIV